MNNPEISSLNFINKHVMNANQKMREGFRSRTRNLYSTAYFEGLIQTIAFAYSKIGENKIINAFSNDLKLEDFDDEGYGLYLLAILTYLKEKGYKIDGKMDTTLELCKKKDIENEIFIYMRWLKYFAEAKIEKSKG